MKNQMYEIVQQTQYMSEKQIENGLREGFKAIEKYAYILHDKDIKEDGTPKAPHYHVYLRFHYSVDSKNVASWFGVEEQYINKIKGRFVDACLYANHANAPDKYQYDIKNIISNFDIGAYQKTKEKSISKNQEIEYIEDIIDRICTGEIRKYNLSKYIDGRLYSKYATRLNRAFDYFHNDWCLKNRNSKIQVWFMTGGSGNGKSTYAQGVADALLKSGEMQGVCVSSASNDPMQDYAGQDILLLEDLRDNAFKYQDLLKMLDNNTRSSSSSRYNNKTFYGKLIIISSVEPIANWYTGIKEDKKQLYRRITKYFDVINDEIHEYNIIKGDIRGMEFVRSFHNAIPDFVKLAEEQNKVKEININVVDVFESIANTFNVPFTDENKETILKSINYDANHVLPF